MLGRSPMHRRAVILLSLMFAALAIGPSALATGCTGSQRQATLRAQLVALDTARDGLITWSTRRGRG
jgi:hypothetical protein